MAPRAARGHFLDCDPTASHPFMDLIRAVLLRVSWLSMYGYDGHSDVIPRAHNLLRSGNRRVSIPDEEYNKGCCEYAVVLIDSTLRSYGYHGKLEEVGDARSVNDLRIYYNIYS